MTPDERKAAHMAAIEQAMLIEFLECARYNILISGPKFSHWDHSALDRLLKKVRDHFDAEGIGI